MNTETRKTSRGIHTSTRAIKTTFSPFELRINEEFTRETAVVITQVENKQDSRNRKALSWIARKSSREVTSRTKSAITSAAKYIGDKHRYLIYQISAYSQIILNMATCFVGIQMMSPRVRCGSQTQNAWPIRTPNSNKKRITIGKRCRLRLSLPSRISVRRIERRANLS